MARQARPLSPHVGIYRWQVSNTLSILHRLTGVMLSFGAVMLTGWVVALASGPDAYAVVARWLGSPLGLLALCALTFCFFYHLCNGIRHLFWDAGYGFEIPRARATGMAVVAAAVALNLVFWLVVLTGRGELMVRLRSPLGRVLGLGSARSGYGHWWGQRLSAAALVLLGLWFLLSVPGLSGADYGAVTGWVSEPAHAVLLILLLATSLYHSSLGLQVVVEDYVHHSASKVISLVLIKFVHVALAVAGVYAVAMLSAGGPV